MIKIEIIEQTSLERIFEAPTAEQQKQYRESIDWMRLYEFFQNGFYHSTSLESWEAIKSTGAILPSKGNDFELRYNWQSKRSYGHEVNGVALFDLGTPSIEQVMEAWKNCHDVIFTEESRRAILLQIDVPQSSILANPSIDPDAALSANKGYIPYCEVWHDGPITTTAITRAFMAQSRERYSLRMELHELERDW